MSTQDDVKAPSEATRAIGADAAASGTKASPAPWDAARPQPAPSAKDPVERIRKLTAEAFVPVFAQLIDKYAPAGIMMELDASNLLEGGRELKIEFSFQDHKLFLAGTVTAEGIAFHETRIDPSVWGQVLSGPMLRLRHLDAQVFRDFLCERLALLIRNATRKA